MFSLILEGGGGVSTFASPLLINNEHLFTIVTVLFVMLYCKLELPGSRLGEKEYEIYTVRRDLSACTINFNPLQVRFKNQRRQALRNATLV